MLENVPYENGKEKAYFKAVLNNSLLHFSKYFFQALRGEEFKLNWHHYYICAILERVYKGLDKNVILNVCPGAGKTNLVSTMFPLYCYSQQPHSRFLLTSYSEDLAEGISQSIKDVIMSPEFNDLYPGMGFKLDNNRKDSWILRHYNRDVGEFFCASIRGRITGHRAGYLTNGFSGAIILDDVNKPADCSSESKRAEAFDLVYNTVRSRKCNSDVPMVLVQQRLATGDVSGMLMEKAAADGWSNYYVPALIDKAYYNRLPEVIKSIAAPSILPQIEKYGVASYWEEKESLDELMAIKEVDPFTFNAQYMQSPQDRSGKMINISYFNKYQTLPDKFDSISIFADTAVGVKNYNDYSVLLAVGEYQKNVYLLEMIHDRMEMPQLIQTTKSFCATVMSKYKSSPFKGLYIEFKSSGQGLIQTLRQETSLPIIDMNPKGDKVLRVSQVLPYIEGRRVFVPESAPWLDNFLYEVASFSPDMSHKHDDMVDCLVYSLEVLYLNKIKANVLNLRY